MIVWGGVVVMNKGNTLEVNNVETLVEVKEVTPDWATDEEAIQAAKDVIRRKELESNLNALEANFDALTAKYEADQASYKEEKVKLEKELGLY
jgi:hypothetical protein